MLQFVALLRCLHLAPRPPWLWQYCCIATPLRREQLAHACQLLATYIAHRAPSCEVQSRDILIASCSHVAKLTPWRADAMRMRCGCYPNDIPRASPLSYPSPAP